MSSIFDDPDFHNFRKREPEEQPLSVLKDVRFALSLVGQEDLLDFERSDLAQTSIQSARHAGGKLAFDSVKFVDTMGSLAGVGAFSIQPIRGIETISKMLNKVEPNIPSFLDQDYYELVEAHGIELSDTEEMASNTLAFMGGLFIAGNKIRAIKQVKDAVAGAKLFSAKGIAIEAGIDLATSITTSVVVNDASKGSLVDLLDEHTELDKDAYIRWLQDADDDTVMETRFKNLGEDILLGGALSIPLKYLGDTYTFFKGNVLNNMPEGAVKANAMEIVIGSGDGAVAMRAMNTTVPFNNLDSTVNTGVYSSHQTILDPIMDGIYAKNPLANYKNAKKHLDDALKNNTDLDTALNEVNKQTQDVLNAELIFKSNKNAKVRDMNIDNPTSPSQYYGVPNTNPKEVFDAEEYILRKIESVEQTTEDAFHRWTIGFYDNHPNKQAFDDYFSKLSGKDISIEDLRRQNRLNPNDIGHPSFGHSARLSEIYEDIVGVSLKGAPFDASKIAKLHALRLDTTNVINKTVKQFSDTFNYPEDEVYTRLAQMGVGVEEIKPLILSIQDLRLGYSNELTSIAGKLLKVNAKEIDLTSKEFADLTDALVDAIDLDSSITGIISPVGKALQAVDAKDALGQQIIRNKGKKFRTTTATRRSQKEAVKAGEEAKEARGGLTEAKARHEKFKQHVFKILQSNDPKGKENLLRFVEQISKSNPIDLDYKSLSRMIDNNLTISEMLTAVTFNGMLGSPATMGRIFTSNVISTVVKTNAQGFWENVIEAGARTFGRNDTGQRFIEIQRKNMAQLEVLQMYSKAIIHGDDSLLPTLGLIKGSIEPAGEGALAVGAKSYDDYIQDVNRSLTDNGVTEKAFKRILQQPYAVTNVAVRGSLTAVDNLSKRMATHVGLIEAMSREFELTLKREPNIAISQWGDFKKAYMSQFEDIAKAKALRLAGKIDEGDELMRKTLGDDRFGRELAVDNAMVRANEFSTETLFNADADDLLISKIFKAGSEGSVKMAKTLGSSIGLEDNFENAGRYLFHTLLPFQRTSANLVDGALQHSGLFSGLSSRWRAQVFGDLATHETRVRAFAKTATGLSMFGAGMVMAQNNIMIGRTLPSNMSYEQAETLGVKPYSVLIGDTYYQLDFLGPITSMFFAPADWYNANQSDAEGLESPYMQTIGGFFAGIFNDTHLKTIQTMYKGLSSDADASVIGQLAGQTISNVTSLGTQGMFRTYKDIFEENYDQTDKVFNRKMETWGTKFDARIDNVNRNNPTYLAFKGLGRAILDSDDQKELRVEKKNVLGHAIPRSGRGFTNRFLQAIVGIRNSSSTQHAVLNDLVGFGLLPNKDSFNQIGDVMLTGIESNKFRDLTWDLQTSPLLKNLETRRNDDSYLRLNDVAKKKALQEEIDFYQEDIEQALLQENPTMYLEQRVIDRIKDTVDSGTHDMSFGSTSERHRFLMKNTKVNSPEKLNKMFIEISKLDGSVSEADRNKLIDLSQNQSSINEFIESSDVKKATETSQPPANSVKVSDNVIKELEIPKQ